MTIAEDAAAGLAGPGAESPERRRFLQALGAGAIAAGLPAQLLAQVPPSFGDILTRRIARTGELVPAIGLGTFRTFDALPGQPRAQLEEVMRLFLEGGGRVVDTSPLYGAAEVNVGDFAAKIDAARGMFVASKVWSTGEFLGDESHAERSLARTMERLWRERVDLIQCHSLTNLEAILGIMQAWKREGRVRYLGVTHHDMAYLQPLGDSIERDSLDFVQLHYSIFERRAEARLLPAAADRGTAVLVNMPLEKARLHALVQGRPLPDFAEELGIANWAQFFLKWVISHPAVTCAIPATSNPRHVLENIGAMRGPLPDAAMRRRMVRYMEAIPGFSDLDRSGPPSWYPGKSYPGLITRAQAALRARLDATQ